MRRLIWSLLLLVLPLSTQATEQATMKAWPLVYHAVDEEAGTEHLEIAWPLIDLRTAPEYDSWSLLHLFSRQHNTATDEHRTSGLFDLLGTVSRDEGHWRTWLFPFFWLGKAADSSHVVFFPLYWQFLNGKRHTHAVFPLYFAAGGETSNTHGYLFLVWRGEREYTRGEDQHRQSFTTVFPFYWSSHRELNGETTRDKQALLPLFSRAEEHDHTSALDRDEWRHSALFLARWQHEQETDKDTKRQDQRQQWQVWPLVSQRTHTATIPANNASRSVHETRALGPLVKFGTRESTDGAATSSSYAQRVFPFYFRGGRNHGEQGTYVVLFPCWWDLRKPGGQIQALVPLGARIQDGDKQALNILGPLFTRLQTGEYARYDLLFPFLMVKSGEHTAGFRLWPLYSQHREDGEREGGSICWPLVRWEERSDAQGARTYTPVFGDFADLFGGSSSPDPSGKLTRNVLPFFASKRAGSGWSWWLFPVGGARHFTDPNATCDATSGGPFGLLFLRQVVTDADDRSPRTRTSFLTGAWATERGDDVSSTRAAWLFATERRAEYDAAQKSVTERTSTSVFPIYLQEGTCEREADQSLVISESRRTAVPFLFRAERETRRDDTGEQTGGRFGLLTLFGKDLLYGHRRYLDGGTLAEFVSPLWTHQTTRLGEQNTKSLGGLAYQSERDLCGFSERRLFYRVFRTESNSRRSTWELMPFADGVASTRGNRSLQILGGLFGYETGPERTSLRLAYLLQLARHHAPQTLSEEELQQRAKQHLAYGLDYLKSRTPERALVELSLAEPAFGDDPALYEKLGDACAQVCTRGYQDDFLEQAVQDIKSFSSDYPSSFQWKLAGREGPEALFRARATAAYEKVKALGGDSALLRRRLLRLEPDNAKRAELYAAALRDFPTDFSLRYDGCQQAQGDERIPKWQRLAKDFPRSARAQYGLLDRTQWETTDLPQVVDQALAAAQLPDRPEYIPLYSQPETRTEGFPRLCLQLALDKMETLASHCQKQHRPVDELQWRQRWFETRLDWGEAPHAEWQRRDTIRQFRHLYGELKTEGDLIPYLERAVADLRPEIEREAWQREIRRLKREASFLTIWSVEANGTARLLEGRLFDRYVNLRTAVEDGTTARCSVTLTSPTACEAVILFGFDEEARLELNGQEVFTGRNRIAVADEYRIPIHLNQGANSLSLTLGNRKLAWGFFLRVADPDGNPLDDLVVQPAAK